METGYRDNSDAMVMHEERMPTCTKVNIKICVWGWGGSVGGKGKSCLLRW